MPKTLNRVRQHSETWTALSGNSRSLIPSHRASCRWPSAGPTWSSNSAAASTSAGPQCLHLQGLGPWASRQRPYRRQSWPFFSWLSKTPDLEGGREVLSAHGLAGRPCPWWRGQPTGRVRWYLEEWDQVHTLVKFTDIQVSKVFFFFFF